MKQKTTSLASLLRFAFSAVFFSGLLASLISFLSGCSAGKQGLLSITPQQYFYSAKEKLEIIDERMYEIRDLDEIIRVLENAEKDAKTSEIMDKSRLYLTLTNTLKAEKQYKENRLKGQYVANRPEPFFALDLKPVKETLRVAKKWLRLGEAQFKTRTLESDLLYVKGMYYTQKMLTQIGDERRESFNTAVYSLRRCLGIAPDYKSDFRLFGKIQTPREVRLKLIECLTLGGELTDAYSMISEYTFSPATPRLDYQWAHMKGFVLACMGHTREAAETLQNFKIVLPQDYPKVDDALWLLEGVYDRMKEENGDNPRTDTPSMAFSGYTPRRGDNPETPTPSMAFSGYTPHRGDNRAGMDAKITASLLKRLKGPYSKEKYTTAAHLFPHRLPGDATYFNGLVALIKGDFIEARACFAPIRKGGLISSGNRFAARILAMENELYAGAKVSDELIEDLLSVAVDKDLSPLLRERIGFLLARYLMGEYKAFKQGPQEGEGQTFVKAMNSKPWTLDLRLERPPKVPRGKQPPPPMGMQLPKESADTGGLRAEIYAQRPEDWIVSVNLSLVLLPEMNLVGKGRIVGREEEGKGWVFKSPEIDEIAKGNRYLAILEYANSDNEKSLQGVLLDYQTPKIASETSVK